MKNNTVNEKLYQLVSDPGFQYLASQDITSPVITSYNLKRLPSCEYLQAEYRQKYRDDIWKAIKEDTPVEMKTSTSDFFKNNISYYLIEDLYEVTCSYLMHSRKNQICIYSSNVDTIRYIAKRWGMGMKKTDVQAPDFSDEEFRWITYKVTIF